MNAYINDLEKNTEQNEDFRRVLFTGPKMQLVVMSLNEGEEIGEETHENTDQFFRIEEGKGEIVLDGRAEKIEEDMGILVPAGTRHNLRNTGHEVMKLYTLYSPPQHARDTVQHTKADAGAEVAHA